MRHYGAKDFDFTAPGGIIDLRLYKSTDDVLALFKDDPLVAPPGEKYLYSTFGYSLVMVVVEKAAGASFLDLLQSELLDSLEMKHTCGDDLRKIVPGRTDFYDRGPNGVIVQSYPVNAAYKWSGGGLLATAEDLARFGAAHLQPGFFSAETLNVMFTPQKTAASEETASASPGASRRRRRASRTTITPAPWAVAARCSSSTRSDAWPWRCSRILA